MSHISLLEDFYLMYASNFAETLIKEATSPNWKRKIVQILDALSDTLCKETDVSEFIRIAHPNAKVMQAVEDACVNSVVKHTHKELYSALGRVQEFVDLLKPMETTQNGMKLAVVYWFISIRLQFPSFDVDFGIAGLPTLMLFRQGRLNDRI